MKECQFQNAPQSMRKAPTEAAPHCSGSTQPAALSAQCHLLGLPAPPAGSLTALRQLPKPSTSLRRWEIPQRQLERKNITNLQAKQKCKTQPEI